MVTAHQCTIRRLSAFHDLLFGRDLRHGLRARLRGRLLHDPDLLNLRKAARTAIVMPLAYFIGAYPLGSTEAGIFASFAGFAALAFADFGGSAARKTRAYTAWTLVSAPLVALGTVVSRTTVTAAVLTAVVAFVVVMAASLGASWEAGRNATILAFVLAACVTAPNSQVDDRIAGWVVGSALAGFAAVALWPSTERHRVRRACATVLARAGAALTADGDERAVALGTLDDAVAALRALTGVRYRPLGTATADRALKLTVIESERLARLVHTTHERLRHPDPDERALVAASVATLHGIADRLVTFNARTRDATADPSARDPLALDALHRARGAHLDSLEARARAAATTGDAAGAVTAIDSNFPLRRLSLMTLALATNASTAADLPVPVLTTPGAQALTLDPGLAGKAGHTEREVRAQLHLRSVAFRNAVRAAVGLGAAMALAKATDVDHGFWVVLGTLSVLRSNALGTQRSARQAIEGTVVGFLLASLLMAVVGGDTTWLWIALPPLAFLSAYTPGTVNFTVGQACFTVLVVDLFNLGVPEGWRTGLVRLQDIALGVGVSIVVGFVLWPRGAMGVVRATFADFVRAGSAALDAALDATVAGGDPDAALDAARRAEAQLDAAEAARDRTLVALEALAAERGVEQADRSPWSELLLLGTGAIWASEGIARDGRTASHTGAVCAPVRDDVVHRGRGVQAELANAAGRVEHLPEPPRAAATNRTDDPTAGIDTHDDVHDAVDALPHAQLAADLTRCVQEGGELPVELLWSREWILLVERLLHVPDSLAPLTGPA